MTHAGTKLPAILRLLALAAVVWLPQVAFADDYATVNQLHRSGKTADAGVARPMLTAPVNAGVDGGSVLPNIPKTLWYARGFGKVKEAGGGEPTEELSGLQL